MGTVDRLLITPVSRAGDGDRLDVPTLLSCVRDPRRGSRTRAPSKGGPSEMLCSRWLQLVLTLPGGGVASSHEISREFRPERRGLKTGSMKPASRGHANVR